MQWRNLPMSSLANVSSSPIAAMPRLSGSAIGILFAVLAAIGFSFKAILVKLAYPYGVDTVTLLALSLTACATKPQTLPADSPALPPPPSLSTPLPLISYSLSAAEVIKAWRRRQMGTRLMSEPTEKPGQ